VAAEFGEQVPDLDTMLIAVGGGGLLAGTLAALDGTSARAVAIEPFSARSHVQHAEFPTGDELRPLAAAEHSPGEPVAAEPRTGPCLRRVLAHQMQAVPVPRATAAMWASCAST
jgi:hypothetical protein